MRNFSSSTYFLLSFLMLGKDILQHLQGYVGMAIPTRAVNEFTVICLV
jgi:hypothetical protein